jgi:hypothetical protein
MSGEHSNDLWTMRRAGGRDSVAAPAIGTEISGRNFRTRDEHIISMATLSCGGRFLSDSHDSGVDAPVTFFSAILERGSRVARKPAPR